ncbi:hypothetical protein GLOIN_2v1787998 [Rhizophagus clarus]|uniref:RING-type domain-containing protein n=1 Tax=Rhizophagus clarus TaxID=94130 RepID=A0A8H3QFL0_9GLOM|nr:hypothetical protein GLOIN_2v1787998 [Rhizophagus clarus]
MKTENPLNSCNFYSTNCKGRIRTIARNTDIPATKKEIISVGMKLCQTHYNKFIINETHNFKHNKPCSHPKHDIYTAQSKNANKKSKKLNLVNGEELKQLELDFQEILEHITIPNEVSLSDKIIKISNVLYNYQHKLNQKSIYDLITFKTMLEAADEDLIRFFDELYIGTNPHTKSNKTNENNRKKLVSLCYFLASINNKYINSIKADIESYLQTFGISPSSIDTLANIGFSITRKIVNRQKNLISNEHQQTVNDYCLQNIEKMFVLNIDDYHNIHFRNMPSLLETHNIFHFVTILLNSNSNITTIPYCSNNILIHNPKEIDSKLIIKNFENFFMKQIGKSYYKQNKLWKQFLVEDSYENRVENLNVHDYDGRIQNHQELRSLNNSKLVDFILHLLHSTKDYIESEKHYFKPIIFFLKNYHNLFGEKKILSQKPKQTVINLILDLTFNGWKKIRNVIIHHFENSKDAEYRMMIDLLDNSIPLTLDIYAILFRSGYFKEYLKGVARIWVLFQRLRQHNYNKAPLMFLSDVFYWKLNNHPIANTLENYLPIFNDYFVENFHSSIRSQTAESNTALQIIQKAKVIDIERNSKLFFKDAFVNSRNPVISQVKLNYLEKKVSLFLFSLFEKILHNLGNTNQINNNKYPSFVLLTFKINVDVKTLPLAWSTKSKPFDEKFCDAENCLLSDNVNLSNNIILICGHGFHRECLTSYNGNCVHCFSYLSLKIKKNIDSLTERLNIPLKNNEKPLVKEDTINDTNDNNDENIQDIIENLEQNIDNQFEILYQKWTNYDSL